MRHIGMHIGGGPNDADTKKPFLKAIEARNLKYLTCYRLVKEPLKGGTFGVDLLVGTQGGVPEVRKTRQRLGGDEFESCMVDAFNAVQFKPTTKPTTLSYSLRFDVEDASASSEQP